MILIRDFHLIRDMAALLAFVLVTNFILGQFKPGFEGQPVTHTDHLWNFLGMALAGLAFCSIWPSASRNVIKYPLDFREGEQV